MNFSGLWIETLVVCIICILGIVCVLCFCKKENVKLRLSVIAIIIIFLVFEVVSFATTLTNIEKNTIASNTIYHGIDQTRGFLLWNGYVFEFEEGNENEVLHLNMFTARQLGLDKLEEGQKYIVTYEKHSRVILSVEQR